MDRPAKAAKTQAEWFGDQAYASWQQGQDAFAAGRLDDARRWLERARRFAPVDVTVALSLAVVLLRQNDRAAEALFLEVTRTDDVREAWFGLAASRAQAENWAGAAASLGHMLARHAVADVTGVAQLANRVVAANGGPGWVCQGSDGRLHATIADGGGAARPRAWLDGVCLRRPPLFVPASGAALALTVADKPLLGSPLDLTRFRRLDGFVAAESGSLVGWAWHPANPEADPLLFLRAGNSKPMKIIASEVEIPSDRPLTRPRRFIVPAAALATLGPRGAILHVTGVDQRNLPGSPIALHTHDCLGVAISRSLAETLPVIGPARRGSLSVNPAQLAVPADLVGPPVRAPRAPGRRLAVVIPAYANLALTRDCLTAAQNTMPAGTTIIVVDDASPEPELAALLDTLAAAGRIRLIRHPTNRGFPAAANTGLRAAAALPGLHDIVLLNADALLTAGALAALRALVQASPDIGTATPLSNDATILSYPVLQGNALPAPAELARLGRFAAAANAGMSVDIPTGVGFCMYIRRECLLAVGLFREHSFAQGYGEENDFCLRARHLGFRHVAAPGVFVGHAGGASFRAGGLNHARTALIARNQRTLERLHPGYHDLIAAHQAADPLAEVRRRLDAVRWAARRKRSSRAATILVTHDSGGGVERVIRARCAELAAEGRRAIVLRPVRDPAATQADARTYLPGRCEVCDGPARDTPNLRFTLPAELEDLVRLLRPERPASVEIHHLLGHDLAITTLAARLAVPWEVFIHDHIWFCPRVTLLGRQGAYCGEPTDIAICEACIVDTGRNDEQSSTVAETRSRSAAILAGAEAVFAGSSDSAARIHRHFQSIRPRLRPLEDDAALPPRRPRARSAARRFRVGVVGAIGLEKGYDIVLACAREAAARDLPLEFVVIGHTIDDHRLLATGRSFVTGPYRETEVLDEIRRQSPDLAFLPSIWPETWCFALGEAWRAGLDVLAFDIGAPAERIRGTGRGWLLPLGSGPAAINDFLLNAASNPPAHQSVIAQRDPSNPKRSRSRTTQSHA